MNRTQLLLVILACLALSGELSLLLAQTPGAGIEQQLRSQYRIASVGNNGVVVRAGSVVVVQMDGITALPVPNEWPCNTYKQGGRIKQSTLCAMNWSPSKDSTRLLQVGEKAYVTAIQLKPTEVVFKVQTYAENATDTPFRAAVSFQFQKGFLDSMKPKEIQDTIGQIFAPDASSPTGGSEPPNPPTALSGLYFMQQTGSQLQLNTDGSFSVQASDGQVSRGHFTVNGDTLALTDDATGSSHSFRIQGDKLYATSGSAFVRKGDTPALPPVPVPLKLPSTYVSSRAPADQLQLNADNSFSLQEAGQTYHGTFAVSGSTLELNISDTNTKTTATIQGNNLSDSSGQTWTLREQSGGTAPSGAMLQNEDVIKMAKAGFDDAIIIAKISSSKCQFDTSTDALIRLKQSGVSAAVLKAMLGAGK